MVHVEDAALAGGAVVAAFGLEGVAEQAVTLALALPLVQEEAPVDRHAAGVRYYHPDERPQHQQEEDVEDYQQRDEGRGTAVLVQVCVAGRVVHQQVQPDHSHVRQHDEAHHTYELAVAAVLPTQIPKIHFKNCSNFTTHKCLISLLKTKSLSCLGRFPRG